MNARRNISIVIAIVLSIGLTSNTMATLIGVDLTKDGQGEGNKGQVFRPIDEFGNPAIFELTAMSNINKNDPVNPIAVSFDNGPGTVYICKDGAGVQNHIGGGSKGISGGGGDQDEELIFTFDHDISLDEITLGLAKIEYENNPYVPGAGFKDDDPVLFLHSSVGDWYVVTEGAISAVFSPNPGENDMGTVNLGGLIPDRLIIDFFKVREPNGHILVNQIVVPEPQVVVPEPQVVVPEPATIALLGFGSMILIKRSKSRKDWN